MAMNKKGSRHISVNGIKFRYKYSSSQHDGDWNFEVKITVQHEMGTGAYLQIVGLITRDYWLDFPEIHDDDENAYPIVTPKIMMTLIQKALSEGWDPTQKGKPYILQVENSEIFPKSCNNTVDSA